MWLLDGPDYLEYSPLFPNPLICLRDMVTAAPPELYDRLPWNGVEAWLKDTWNWVYLTMHLDWDLVLLPLAIAIALSFLRIFCDYALLKRLPIWFKLEKASRKKVPESIWKGLIYTFTWCWAIYLVVDKDFFFYLRSHWDTWYPGVPIDSGLYWLYMFQMGFYLHSAYATVYIETIRQDFVVLMLHHVLTLGLLMFSLCARYHNIGLLVLFVQDVGDVFLELSKTFNYFKVQDGKEAPKCEMTANVCFAIFTLQHILFRLYWYPTKVIYSSMYVSVQVYPGGPYWIPFNIMLWALYAMQVYWFKFIVRLLVKILIYKEKISDTRDYDSEEEAEEEEKKREQANGPMEESVRKRQRTDKGQ